VKIPKVERVLMFLLRHLDWTMAGADILRSSLVLSVEWSSTRLLSSSSWNGDYCSSVAMDKNKMNLLMHVLNQLLLDIRIAFQLRICIVSDEWLCECKLLCKGAFDSNCLSNKTGSLSFFASERHASAIQISQTLANFSSFLKS
jgi:hypothetical protein